MEFAQRKHPSEFVVSDGSEGVIHMLEPLIVKLSSRWRGAQALPFDLSVGRAEDHRSDIGEVRYIANDLDRSG